MEFDKAQQEITEAENYYHDGVIVRDELLARLISLGGEFPPQELAKIIPKEYLQEIKVLRIITTPPKLPNEVLIIGGSEQEKREYIRACNLWHDFFAKNLV